MARLFAIARRGFLNRDFFTPFAGVHGPLFHPVSAGLIDISVLLFLGWILGRV